MLTVFTSTGAVVHTQKVTAGKAWSVYSISGLLVYRAMADGEEADVNPTVKGMYIIISDNETATTVCGRLGQ
ncbi:MAG: hypothetical protein LBS09_06180 [Bacteroidales bacterium]|jgi:hypothetical protein|nr:hypothetical protein [Bacteroidales bacterium]